MFLQRRLGMKTQKQLAATIIATLSFFVFGSSVSFAQSTRTDNQIGYYQELLNRNPRNAKAYYGLGDALIRKARETGDADYFNRAEAALKKSLELAPKNVGAMRHLAYVFYSRHEFEPAAVHARKAIALDSTDADAYGILGDALLETGQYEGAEEAYRKMMDLEKNLYSYSRLAGLESMRGDSAGATADLERAIVCGKAQRAPAESIAWAQWQLGSDQFSLGNLEKAEANYRHSLDTYPNYYRALAGMAQMRAAQKRYTEAVEFYQKAIAILPMPDYVAALGDVYANMGNSVLAKQQYELVEYIGRLTALNQILYNRELAYFYADHEIKPKEALELAQRELDYRRDIYAYDVFAWSLYRNGKFEEARSAIQEALKLGTKDAKLLFHAGMIYQALGETDKAKDFLARALAMNPQFHVLLADKARTILGQLEELSTEANSAQEHHGG
jgi:tetratricopeptide (TPR) repeat protein